MCEHTEQQENSKSGTLQERYQSQGSSVFQLSYLFVIESIRVVTLTNSNHPTRPLTPPEPGATSTRSTAWPHRVPVTHPGRPAHARPPTERPCWTRSVAMRPLAQPSRPNLVTTLQLPCAGDACEGAPDTCPAPAAGAYPLEPRPRRALSLHCPRASATHLETGHTREQASSIWPPLHRPSVCASLEPAHMLPAALAPAQRLQWCALS